MPLSKALTLVMTLSSVSPNTTRIAFNGSSVDVGDELHVHITPFDCVHLPTLVEHVLATSYFTVGLTVFRQCQGASMGSPLAPALCSAVALFREYCFLRPFPSHAWRYATGLALRARYVDNVFFIGAAHMLHTDSFRVISQPFFYGNPV